jgi:hypothetical protein
LELLKHETYFRVSWGIYINKIEERHVIEEQLKEFALSPETEIQKIHFWQQSGRHTHPEKHTV